MVTLVPQVPLPASTAITVTVNGLEESPETTSLPRLWSSPRAPARIRSERLSIATNITAYGVTNVPTNAQFQITFDEPMDVGTVLANAQSFLYDYTLGYLAGTAR